MAAACMLPDLLLCTLVCKIFAVADPEGVPSLGVGYVSVRFIGS